MGAHAAPSGRGYPTFDWHRFSWDHSYLADDLSSTPVSTWADGSGSDDLTQGTGADQPAWSATSGPNSQPGVTVDGSTDHMITGELTAPITTPGTVVIIGNVVALPSAGGMYFSGNDATDLWHAQIMNDANSNKWRIYSGSSVTSAGSATTGDHTMRAYYHSSGGLWVDGSSVLSGDTGSNQLDGIIVGEYYTGSFQINFTYSAIGVYSGDAASDGDWSALQNYVSTKWGLTL